MVIIPVTQNGNGETSVNAVVPIREDDYGCATLERLDGSSQRRRLREPSQDQGVARIEEACWLPRRLHPAQRCREGGGVCRDSPLFDSIEAVRQFAGPDYTVPVFEPEARLLL